MIKQVTSKTIAMKSDNDGGETDVLMRSKEGESSTRGPMRNIGPIYASST